MVIFKRIEIDLDTERKRIKVGGFTRAQRAALTKLYDLFEAGEWKKCLQHVCDKKAFPYNRKGEYPEVEHIDMDVSNILHDLRHSNYYTAAELLKQARLKIAREIHRGKSEKN